MNDNYISVPNLYADFTLAVAGPEQTESIYAVMEKVRADLPTDNKHYLKPMRLAEVEHHAKQGNILIASEDDTGRIAGALMLTPVNRSCAAADKFAEYPHHLMSQDTAVIKIFVDGDFGGQGVMGALLKSGEQLATKQGFLDVIAKVDVNNGGSNKGFERADFSKAASGTDPVLGYAVHYWHKTCSPLASAVIPRLNGQAHDNDQPATFSPESLSPV